MTPGKTFIEAAFDRFVRKYSAPGTGDMADKREG